MAILLVRHARAVHEGAGLVDEHRFLSQEGRTQARALGDVLAQTELRVGAFLTSPLVRAVQTAELLASQLGFRGSLEASDLLSTHGASRATTGMLETRAAQLALGEVLVAVGHEPSMTSFAGALSGQTRVASFHTAEAVLIADGRIEWRLAAN